MSSTSYEMSGILHEVFDEQVISEKLTVKKFILQTDPQGKYPQYIQLQLANQKISLLEEFVPGDELKCQVNVNGRKVDRGGETKYFTVLEAWKIERN